MIKENITKTPNQKQGEFPSAEIKAFVALARVTQPSLRECSEILIKIEKWEAMK